VGKDFVDGVVFLAEGEGWEGSARDFDVTGVVLGDVFRLEVFEEGVCFLMELNEFGGVFG
jgi:hypothetical protein